MLTNAQKFFLALIIILPGYLSAQTTGDTLSLNLQQAETLFYKNNLQLLAQQFSIDSAKANVLTAKLIDNPELNFSSDLYQTETKRFFDFGKETGEISAQVSQLIKTAGKRVKNIAVMQTGVKITEYQYYDLIRTLLLTLRTDFYNLYYLQRTQAVYNLEITSLSQTTKAFEEQVAKGNIARNDLLRMKTQLYSLQAELATLQTNMLNVMSEFRLLLRTNAATYVAPVVLTDPSVKNEIAKASFGNMKDSTLLNRYDLKAANAQVLQSEQNLRLQKALAVPDITLSSGYDKLGSYIHNFNSLGIGFSIPIFNRNQGNIQQAKAMIGSNKLQLNMKQDQVESQLMTAYMSALKAQEVLSGMDPNFPDQVRDMIQKIQENYIKRNISLLEFIDYYDSYKQNVVQLNNLKFNLVSQLEQLNYATGTRFFNK